MKLTNSLKTLATASAVALTLLGVYVHADNVANIPGVAEQPATYFYTGKPYDADLGAYTFAARNYNPEINRWTTPDPSGFPDGANNQFYAPVPTSDFDYQGLLKWSTLTNLHRLQAWTHGGNNLTSEVWSVNTDDGSATITLWKNTTGGAAGTNYTFNCHGYTFGNSEYWINSQVDDILRGDGYKLITSQDKSLARVAYWGGDIHSAKVNTVSGGTVTQVTGKLGAGGLATTTVAGQGYGGTTAVTYWE
jgi:RHS repeat-associated protein